MNPEQQILTILYEMSMVIGGEVSVKPLLTKTLQQLLYHTSFPAGLVFLDLPPDTGGDTVEARLAAVVGDFELGERVGQKMTLPAALLRGNAEMREDPNLLSALAAGGGDYAIFLRLPINPNGVILLLAARGVQPELPFAQIFQPVMANLSKAILLCRHHEAFTAGLVAERDVAWENLRKVNRTLKTLSSGNEVLVRASDEIALLEEMCRVVVEVGGYRSAWVGYAEQDETKSVRKMALSGDGADILATLDFTWADDDELGRAPIGAAIRSGDAQMLADVQTDPRFAPWREQALASGCASILALPLKDETGQAFGALTIDAGETNAFDTEEISLLSELASDLAYGIVNLRSRAEQLHSAAQLHKSLEDAIQAIAATVEMRDPYTAGHQRRVAQLAEAIALKLGLDTERIHGIRLASKVHDVGKIGLPAEILTKPGTLTPVEFNLVKEHSKIGYDILKDAEFPWPIAQMVRSHHERQDGSGYPDGLKGHDILFDARIIGVADVVEAMSSYRPYRPALGKQAALDEILSHRGKRYDAQVVDACCQVMAEGFEFN
jgi:HD-GYP domain-containing protein (c-di-GMP phosphodiesterase class II)